MSWSCYICSLVNSTSSIRCHACGEVPHIDEDFVRGLTDDEGEDDGYITVKNRSRRPSPEKTICNTCKISDSMTYHQHRNGKPKSNWRHVDNTDGNRLLVTIMANLSENKSSNNGKQFYADDGCKYEYVVVYSNQSSTLLEQWLLHTDRKSRDGFTRGNVRHVRINL